MAVKKYTELSVEEWNVRSFQEFIADKHEEILGVTYQPGRGYAAEAGLLGDIVGTQKKPAKYPKPLIKEFILRCLHEYTPRQAYPGMSFLFMWSFRKNTLQQLELEYKQEQRDEEREDVDYEDLEDWL